MLLAHITEFPRNDSTMDVSMLPKYHLPNDPKLGSRLSHLPKVVCPLSERFSAGENCLEPDVKNRMLVVELKSDKRYVQLVEQPTDNDVSTPDMSVSGDNVDASKTQLDAKLSSWRELREKAKSLLRQLAQTGANAAEETCNESKEKQFSLVSSASSGTSLSSDVSDAEIVAARHRPTADAVHHCDRRRKSKPSAMEETWKMLDSALLQKTKSQPEKYGDKSVVKSVHCDKNDKKQVPPVQIPLQLIQLPPELMKTEHHMTDPRLTQNQQRKDGKELDLPLPKFAVNAALAQQPDWSAVDGYDTMPHAPRSADVVVRSGRGTEDVNDQHRSVLPLPNFAISATVAQQPDWSAVDGYDTMPHAQRSADVVVRSGRGTEDVNDQHRSVLTLPNFAINATLAQQPNGSALESCETMSHAQRSADVVVRSGRGTEDVNDQHRSVLPLPNFVINATLAQQSNGSAVESCETMPHVQRPIDVVIGACRVTEAATDGGDRQRDAHFQLMQSLERSLHLLNLLSVTETEFSEFSHELIVIQDKVAAAISKHYDTN